MRISLACYGAVAGLALFVTGCGGGGAEGLQKDVISTMNDMSTTLESIKDDKTADEAIPKLDAQIAKLKELKKKADDLKIPKEEETKLAEKYKPEMEKAMKRFQEATVSAMQKAPSKAKAITESMMKVQ